jgi:hypothetical protein
MNWWIIIELTAVGANLNGIYGQFFAALFPSGKNIVVVVRVWSNYIRYRRGRRYDRLPTRSESQMALKATWPANASMRCKMNELRYSQGRVAHYIDIPP